MIDKVDIENEFIASWDKIENFYMEFDLDDWPQTTSVLEFIKEIREKGFDKLLRAGQSMYNLIISKAVEHGKIYGNIISFTFNKVGMNVHFKGNEYSYPEIKYNASIEYMLSSISKEKIINIKF